MRDVRRDHAAAQQPRAVLRPSGARVDTGGPGAGGGFRVRGAPDADGARREAGADRRLGGDCDQGVELSTGLGRGGPDGFPAGASGSRPDREPAPVRDFGYASPTIERPGGSFEPAPQLAVLSTAPDPAGGRPARGGGR